ncbi:MAG TPA: Spy/CpxP family protein refolding chaperone [Steroidobacteraceae bacterium]|jgi:Spy/CpxP family protein refolding chaperone|nr:Spy/CpxP family protein refolding chaperone [Steroidobacteraceae bacterium]
MKSRAKWLLAAVAMTGMAGAVYAQTTSNSGTPAAAPTATPEPGAGHWHHRHHGGVMMQMLHQLNLTAGQKQRVHAILANARTQAQAQRSTAGAPNFAALANPGDPNHTAALQDLQGRMAARIQARDQIQTQIYGVLTPDQKSQLASLIAARQARMAQRSAAG